MPKQLDKVALTIDLFAMIAAVVLASRLAAQFRQQTTVNVLLIVLVYILFCVAVYLIRKLEPERGPEIIPPRWVRPLPMRLLGILFGVFLMVLLLDQFRYWELIFEVDDRELGAGESSAFFVYGPGAWLGAALFYVLVLSAGVRTTISRHSPRYVTLAAVALLLVNVMVLVGTAVLAGALQRWQLGPAAQGAILLAAAASLWGPPRVWYLAKRPSAPPLYSYLLFLLITIGLSLFSTAG